MVDDGGGCDLESAMAMMLPALGRMHPRALFQRHDLGPAIQELISLSSPLRHHLLVGIVCLFFPLDLILVPSLVRSLLSPFNVTPLTLAPFPRGVYPWGNVFISIEPKSYFLW